jgi:hypothetical protein
MSTLRTRWAAIGAALAITFGAGGIGLVTATSPSDARAFVPITPCRVMDTRPAPNTVGPKSSPLGGGEIHTVTAVGNSGNCTSVPVGAAAVSLNVTAVGATLPTFLTVWAADATQPDASNLNPVPGSPPTPNAVTTELNGDGEFSIYNLQGNVNVIADINGYYVDHHHDDRYYTKAESDDLRPFAAGAERVGAVFLTGSATPVITLDVDAPTDGQVTVNSSALVYHTGAGGDVACFILRSTDSTPFLGPSSLGVQAFEADGADIDNGTIAGTRVFDVSAGTITTFELRCAEADGDGGRVEARGLTAIFTPAPGS